jgi:CDGSH-type Zn-finger protein
MQQISPSEALSSDIGSREELIYLLSRAAELEHNLACIYLFTAFSLKATVNEGDLTDDEATMVRGWKRRLASVAIEEMLHMAQVANLLTAVGGAPHFRRANFPLAADAYPFGLPLSLEPFSVEVIERFVCYEMPEDGVLSPEQIDTMSQIRARRVMLQKSPMASLIETPMQHGCEPFDIDFMSIGEFYHQIERGFDLLPEEELFIGPAETQAKSRTLHFGDELIPVVDVRSAHAAIDMIIEQGEAPTKEHPDAHYAVFDTIRREYEAACEKAQDEERIFEPVRPVASNPMTRFYDDTTGGVVIADGTSHQAADLFNVAYDTMLLMLLRFFSHTDESEEELAKLANATIYIMKSVLRPLGEALTKMPMGVCLPGKTAGPGFGYNRDVHLLPHKPSAWIFIGERLAELASVATGLIGQAGLPTEVTEAAAALQSLAIEFASPSGKRSAEALTGTFAAQEVPVAPGVTPEPNGPYLVQRVDRLVNSRGEAFSARAEMALCRCGGSGRKPFCDGTHARIGFSSAKLPGCVEDRRDAYQIENFTLLDNRGICQHAGFCTDELASVFKLHQEPWIDPNGAPVDRIRTQVDRCPSGALSYAVNGVERPDMVREPCITVSKDGPYRITGRIPLNETGWMQGASREHYALCRCGGSKNKPFCDGTHWSNGFNDEVT